MKPLLLLFLSFFLLGLSPGDSVPDFELKNQDGKIIHLSDYPGKFLLLYFYPKDDTPGCTREACGFRDYFSEFQKVKTVVLGVSTQNEKSHQKFKAKHKLSFDLLVDTDGQLAKILGIGTIPVLGLVHRRSVLISPDAKILKFYDQVNPDAHPKEVLDDIKNLTQAVEN